jgi:hypothetical protein
LFEDHDPGYIHRAVQVHILSTNNIEAVLYKSEYIMPGIGRADIVCPSTGEMWEIKHGGSSNDAWDAGISNANARLDKYLLNGCSFKKGRAKAFSGAFVISLDATKYLISYSTPEQGVILYTVMQLNDPQRKENFAYAPHTLYQEQKELMGIIAFAFVGSAISPFPQQEILMDA